MRTGSLRVRVMVATLGLLVLVLTVVIAAVTLGYRSSLRSDIQDRLVAASTAVARSGSAATAAQLTRGLALDGIATNIDTGPPPPTAKAGVGGRAPVKPGATIAAKDSFLVATDVLSDGSRVTFTASQAPITRAISKLLILEIAIGVGALALAALLVLRATKAALRPLSHVVDTASLIAAGDTTLRLQPSRTDTELGAMAATFDQMVNALERAVTDARNAEATMRRFLADASHELRTPVAALQAGAESLLRDQPDRPERDEREAALAAAAARLGRLIDDLLSLARLEGSGEASYEKLDLAELTKNVVEEARLHSTGVSISLDACGARVRGDAPGLARVVRNLLDNALAATPPSGLIAVTVRNEGNTVELRVADTGPGVPDADRERIFHRFVRLGNLQSPGTGLGLAIARRIARQHEGDLTCEKAAQGGSFVLRLPASLS